METAQTFLEEIQSLQKKIPLCLRKDRFWFQRRLKELEKKVRRKEDADSSLLQLMDEVEYSIGTRNYRLIYPPRVFYPKHLPILDKKDTIISAIREHPVIVIAGETGSGKTTQLPKMCIEAGLGREGKIGCTQPRRVAATSIARYVAQEVEGGDKSVVYKVRFQTNDVEEASIKFMTDGILLMEIQSDRFLDEYDTLIIDEAHERSLNIDFILGCLKNLLAKRNDLKVIISSATIDTESFSEFFNKAPIIEVSGRMYPVEVFYNPIDKELEESGDVTMIDMAANTTAQIFEESDEGDVLIFMPGEADIRETIERLSCASWCKATVLPLFSRLTADEQNLIFDQNMGRKVIVATNIAETSITIPGIHYVIDTGNARLSRYCPHSKTQRLPIESISQSSAEQRKGRCGRVEDGVCIRLYSEDDYDCREKYTPPEIKRSDLAEVILRMLIMNMGDIETFPFIDPPSKSSISDGLNTLHELGALDSQNRLTSLGREMSKLPIDPRTARILLAAIQEKSLYEVLIIVSALSIHDPRERPFDKTAEADEKHHRFLDKDSDFMTFLNLWNEYHSRWEELKNQNKIRKFCRQNFLSYVRMREWCDLHEELTSVLEEQGKLDLNQKPASYDQIHRAIAVGYLSHICEKKEKNIYYTKGNKEIMVFPGSAQFNTGHEWIVAAELVETSRLFARTVGKIDASWLEELAKHLITYTYHDPKWDRKMGQVIAKERVMLWNFLIVPERNVHYGRINRKESREIFVRDGIVPGEMDTFFPFLEDNLALINSVIEMENKVRKRNILADESEFYRFYLERMPDVVTVHELREYLKKNKDDRHLLMTLDDVISGEKPNIAPQDFPERFLLGTQVLSLRYRFQPGSDDDGITVSVPIEILHQLDPDCMEWIIPGWLEEKIYELLKALSKEIRKRLNPIADRCQEIFAKIPRRQASLLKAIQSFVQEHYDVKIRDKDWRLATVPTHLFLRFEVMEGTRCLCVGRDLEELQNTLRPRRMNPEWAKAMETWFLPNIRTWCFGDLAESVEITPFQGDMRHLGYPGLEIVDGRINRTLFGSFKHCRESTKMATGLLLQYCLAQDFMKLERNLELPNEMVKAFYKHQLAGDLKAETMECIKQSLLQIPEMIRRQKDFEKKRDEIRELLANIATGWKNVLSDILEGYYKILEQLNCGRYLNPQGLLEEVVKDVRENLDQLLSPQFLRNGLLDRLSHYPRYLKAIHTRLVRANIDPARDRKKWEEVAVHLENLDSARQVLDTEGYKEVLDDYRWLIEEFKVSLFAQELKTPIPVSQQRLEQKWNEIMEAMMP